MNPQQDAQTDEEQHRETLDILGDPETMAQLQQSEKDIAEGRVTTISADMTLDDLRRIAD